MGGIWQEQGSWSMTASWRGRGNEGKVIEQRKRRAFKTGRSVAVTRYWRS